MGKKPDPAVVALIAAARAEVEAVGPNPAIDLAQCPDSVDGKVVVVHRLPAGKNGARLWRFSPEIVDLFPHNQDRATPTQVLDLFAELRQAKAFPLNAAVLAKLLERPDLVPADWRGKIVLFLGTRWSGRVKTGSAEFIQALDCRGERSPRPIFVRLLELVRPDFAVAVFTPKLGVSAPVQKHPA